MIEIDSYGIYVSFLIFCLASECVLHVGVCQVFCFSIALLLFWVPGRDDVVVSLGVVLHMCMCIVAFTCDC